MLKTSLAALAVAILAAPAAFAQETPHAGYRETGAQQDWVGIYSPDRGVEKTTASCAIYSRPVEAAVFDGDDPADVMRGELAAFIAWESGDASIADGQVSFMLGTPLIEGLAEAHGLTVDGEVRFDLVGVGDRLYIRPEDDADAIAALRGGTAMVVTAETVQGAIVKDTYSLMGVQGVTAVQLEACL